MKRTFRIFCIAISFALVVNLVGVPAMPARAASFVVTTNADSGAGSLRQAILDANANGADTITFAADYTITLASQLPAVTTEIIINGNGAANTIIQANAAPNTATYRVFEVTSAGYLTLDGLTVRNGRCDGSCATAGYFGGGVYNTGALTVSNVTFSANYATYGGGGMYNINSSPTLTNVTFSANSASAIMGTGGGMLNDSSSNPTLMNVTFSANSASMGGGMYNDSGSSPTLTNVTFSANSATVAGGGMHNYNSSPTLTNVTFSANYATYRGGGMYNNLSSPTLTNTVIADSSSGGDCVNFNTSTLNAASSNNLIEDAANACGLTDGANGNFIGQNPALGALADNGGSTQNHALLIGSPAINTGTNTGCPLTDQRGVTRDSSCDIGAFESEMQTGPTFTVNTNADTNDSSCDVLGQGIGNQDCTLREALNTANAISGADTITFAADYTITLSNKLPAVTTEIILNGNGAANTIIQANAAPYTAAYRVFEVTSAGNLTLDGLTVRNGSCNGSCATEGYWGGGVYNAGALTVSNVTFSANYASYRGGGMYNINSSPTLTNVTFSGNIANNGGGMYNINSSPTLTNVTFSANSAFSGAGGGMYNINSSPTLTNVTFSGNTANNGGGMFNESSSPTLTNVTFSANSAISGAGGGMHNENGSSPTLTSVTFSANSASMGGGMYNNYSSSPTLTNTIIADSSSGGDCVNLNTSTVNAQNSLIEDGLTCVNGTNINNLTGDPMLNPTLADNGGSTQTHALLTGSPATDAGTNTGCPLTDQRGVTRPQGLFCDIGAVESETYTLTITSANGTVAKNPDQATYHEGDAVQLTATPNADWSFANWTGALTGTANPGTVIIHGNTSVTANYTLNNQAPTDLSLSNNTVEENLPVGTMVGTLSTIDPDAGDTHTYFFCGGTDDTSFAIAGDVLNTAAIFDFETKNSYNVCMRTDDGNGGIFDKAFTIIITDVSDNPIYNIFLPLILR